ncbi:MAG: hypothetical protein ABL958_19950, partial [Bdellovibrionia bacterium]
MTVETTGGQIFNCSGYVSKINNELSLGGCLNRPTDGTDPKSAMIQVRGQIHWVNENLGTSNSRICIDQDLAR